jgi:hypothetical protein
MMILSLNRQLNPNVTFERVTLRSNVEVYSIVTHMFGVNYPVRSVILIVAEHAYMHA